ncbi:MAG: hypothetical protein R3330_08740 [Saprospiraceae bacterium]|nr:hypothetical protein [Saprospiraceae bacterium]
MKNRHEIDRKVNNDNPMGLPAAREIEIRQSAVMYYLAASGRRPEELPRRKRELIGIFRRNRQEIAGFAGTHKLSARKLEDVRKLFAYYNQISAPAQ